MSWQPFSEQETGQAWDVLLQSACDHNPFQSSAWGRYKQELGWQPQRWIARGKEDRIVASVQVLKRSLPFGRSLLWAPGGPVIGYPVSDPENLKNLLEEGIREIAVANRALYARFYSLYPSGQETAGPVSVRLAAPRRRLGSGVTVQLNLTPSLDELQKQMTGKHRSLVRRSTSDGLRWRWGATNLLAADLGRVHAEMARAKRVCAADTGDLRRLLSNFRDHALILVGHHGAAAVTACLVLLEGKSAFYWRAATTREGREISATYGMVLKLWELLKSRGIERFDFGGLLPGVPSAAGINHFKEGFGGKRVAYLGEWEWASSFWIGWGVNAWLAGRRPW